MKKSQIYFGVISLFVASPLLSAPISAVIGLDNSQIIENHQIVSLTPNEGTLLPLQENFSPIIYPQFGVDGNWVNEIGKKVRIEHKQRDLSYTGKLVKLEQNTLSFSISINGKLTTLPLNDFYLIPNEQDSEKEGISSTTFPISYQSNQLSWSPQLNLVLENDSVSVSQQAMLQNRSNSEITLEDSLLHYSRTESPQLLKVERTSFAMDSAPASVTYQNNEVLFPLNTNNLTLPPYSNLLYALPSSKSKINNQKQVANIYTHNNSTGELKLNFDNQINFTFEQDGLPGQYKVFWKKDKLLIPSNTVTLETVRAGHSTSIITNKSQDLKGHLTLLSASSKKYPSTQTWEATIINHSNQVQNYSIGQNTNGILTIIEGDEVNQTSASSLKLSGTIKANSEETLHYKIKLNN
ncbi:hypothetical protein ABFY09_08135 [Marinomonas sp. 5E14-1]|uniref:hypothetical protein n=1 Tax=Marinomonas sp. 5E14-1 TaxID=3153922 RepID=UPI003264195A